MLVPIGSQPTPHAPSFDQAILGALGQASLPVVFLAGDRIVDANPCFTGRFGQLSTAAALSDLAVEQDRHQVARALEQADRNRDSQLQLTFQMRDRQGSDRAVELHWARIGAATAPAVAFLFESAPPRQPDTPLSLAFLDPLTGLPNRAQFIDRCREVFFQARWCGNRFAVMLAAVDGYSEVASTFGQHAGHQVRQEIARRMTASLREQDMASPQNGNRFALLLPDIEHHQDALRVAEQFIERVSAPLRLNGSEVRLTINIGIALYPDHGPNPEPLFALANQALIESQRRGRNLSQLAAGTGEPAPYPVDFVHWDANYAAGISILDEQHRGLFDLANQLGHELLTGLTGERLHATFGRLVAAVRHHFHTEDELLLQHPAAQAEGHSELHDRLLADLQNLRSKLEHPSVALTLRYLEDWLLQHIQGADQQVAQALLADGAS
jgi:hemerythrin-like metal-binding protein/diguanylate cyclase (GGDEF)-like protein